ncbi:MAG: hypothetical protein F6K14_29050 [Symploca sp. SIO2C1]|nr:hypothetical protein [Symploca sp. SIO2C1]
MLNLLGFVPQPNYEICDRTLNHLAEHRGLTFVLKTTFFPSAFCPLPSAFLLVKLTIKGKKQTS